MLCDILICILVGEDGVFQHRCKHGKSQSDMPENVGRIQEWLSVLTTNFAMFKVNMSNVVEHINDKHMSPWAEACTRDGIKNTPLNPFLDQELLYNKPVFLDGSKLEESGFELKLPQLEVATLQQVLDDYLKLGLFPSSLLSGETTIADNDIDSDNENGDGEAVLQELQNVHLENGAS